jgi:hypothetical protein
MIDAVRTGKGKSTIMPRVRTDASKRYGLPEVPGNATDIKDRPRKNTYQQLQTLRTKAYDVREIIYHKKSLTQKKLKEELRAYGYSVPDGETAGDGGALVVLEEITGEITREGAKNDTVITWIGEGTESDTNSTSGGGLADKLSSNPNKEDAPEVKSESDVDSIGLKQGQHATDFPVSERYEVIGGKTIHKEGNWWKAVVLYNDDYGTKIAMYSWKDNGESWTTKQKYRIWSDNEWQQIKQVTEGAIEEVESLFE